MFTRVLRRAPIPAANATMTRHLIRKFAPSAVKFCIHVHVLGVNLQESVHRVHVCLHILIFININPTALVRVCPDFVSFVFLCSKDSDKEKLLFMSQGR